MKTKEKKNKQKVHDWQSPVEKTIMKLMKDHNGEKKEEKKRKKEEK